MRRPIQLPFVVLLLLDRLQSQLRPSCPPPPRSPRSQTPCLAILPCLAWTPDGEHPFASHACLAWAFVVVVDVVPPRKRNRRPQRSLAVVAQWCVVAVLLRLPSSRRCQPSSYQALLTRFGGMLARVTGGASPSIDGDNVCQSPSRFGQPLSFFQFGQFTQSFALHSSSKSEECTFSFFSFFFFFFFHVFDFDGLPFLLSFLFGRIGHSQFRVGHFHGGWFASRRSLFAGHLFVCIGFTTR